MKKRFTKEQIICFLLEAAADIAVAELCEKAFYWDTSRFGSGAPVRQSRKQTFDPVWR